VTTGGVLKRLRRTPSRCVRGFRATPVPAPERDMRAYETVSSAHADPRERQLGDGGCSVEHASEEKELIRKLAATWHLNVPERRALPGGRAKASLLLDAIEEELRSGGWYPLGCKPDDDFRGGLIELTPRGDCRIHWKTQTSFFQYEATGLMEYENPREAATALVRLYFPVDIDGIPIDWQA
jgi:hypothetical protein